MTDFTAETPGDKKQPSDPSPHTDPSQEARTSSSESESVEELFGRYADRLARLAARQLSGKIKSREDAEDIAQSVFRTFIRRDNAGEFQIAHQSDTWHLLAKITLNKVRQRGRFNRAAKRTVEKEAGSLAEYADVVGQNPRGLEVLYVEDEIKQLLKGLPAEFGTMLGLLLEGRTRSEVADLMESSRSEIYRKLDTLQQRLEEHLNDRNTK